MTEKPGHHWGMVIVGGDYHVTFYYTLSSGSKAFTVQFFALQSAFSDFRTKRVAHSPSLKKSHIWKAAEDRRQREEAS